MEGIQFEDVNPTVWKPENPGDSIEGVYVSKKREVGVNKSNAYYLEVLQEGKINEVMIWGTTIIDDRMEFVKIGDPVKIIYKGTKKNKRGQDLKIFNVQRGRKVEKIEEENIDEE